MGFYCAPITEMVNQNGPGSAEGDQQGKLASCVFWLHYGTPDAEGECRYGAVASKL